MKLFINFLIIITLAGCNASRTNETVETQEQRATSIHREAKQVSGKDGGIYVHFYPDSEKIMAKIWTISGDEWLNDQFVWDHDKQQRFEKKLLDLEITGWDGDTFYFLNGKSLTLKK